METFFQIILIGIAITVVLGVMNEIKKLIAPFTSNDPEFDIKAEQKEFKNIKW